MPCPRLVPVAQVPREPDGVTWMGTEYFATADEGDLHGGSRGFTIFSRNGDIVYSSGSDLDHLAARIGHYPEGRSGNKGVEPENVFYGVFSGVPLLFVNLERASLIAVYDVTDPTAPQYRQVLPSSVGPEGGVAVPSRNLVLVAGEKDDRGDKMRSIISIFEGSPHATAQYPPVVSHDRADGTPIPFAALSGLVASGTSTLYAVEDSAYRKSRIFEIDVSSTPAELTREIRIKDDDDILATIGLTEEFTADDLVKLINADKTVNVDPEGIAVFVQSQGGERYLVCTEGSGTIGDTSRPIESLNMGLVLHKGGAKDGVIDSVITLPQAVNDMQLRYGFEGVAVDGATAVFAFQRAWGTEAHPRLGIYDLAHRAPGASCTTRSTLPPRSATGRGSASQTLRPSATIISLCSSATTKEASMPPSSVSTRSTSMASPTDRSSARRSCPICCRVSRRMVASTTRRSRDSPSSRPRATSTSTTTTTAWTITRARHSFCA